MTLSPPLPLPEVDALCLDDGPHARRSVHDVRSQRPEESLLMALLEQTFRDLRSARQSVRRTAEVWITTPGWHAWSFWWVCAHLNLDASYLRCAGMPRLAGAQVVPRVAAAQNFAGLRAKRYPARAA